MTNPLPPHIRYINATRARCHLCGAVMRCSQPWQLHGLALRHAAESHPPQTGFPATPPAG